MKILKNIFLIMFIFPCVAFSVNLEISFGGGVGGSIILIVINLGGFLCHY